MDGWVMDIHVEVFLSAELRKRNISQRKVIFWSWSDTVAWATHNEMKPVELKLFILLCVGG